MTTHSRLPAAVTLAFAVLFLATPFQQWACAQGPLTPPGAPAPTMKALDQVEPRTIVDATNTPGDATNSFIISAPGSYYLSGNITGAPAKHGISIQADDVTLDLNGFAVLGGGSGLRGVDLPAAQNNFHIRNGLIRGWTDGGVRAESGGSGTLIERLRVADNLEEGIYAGLGSLIRDCVATGNTTGFRTSDRCHISNCIATINTGDGIWCTSFVTIVDCTSSRNGTNGIFALSSVNIIRCSATRNTIAGINAGDGCSIIDSIGSFNAGSHGIIAGSGAAVRGCTATGNTHHGILVESDSQVVGNTCRSNVEAGIYSSEEGSRVEGNSSTANGWGYWFIGAHNVLIRNTARGNTKSYELAAGNVFGAIVDRTAPGSAAVSGNSAASSAATTDPWANFSH